MGLSQTQVANRLGVAQSKISKIESHSQLTIGQMVLYAKIGLGIDPKVIILEIEDFTEKNKTKF